MEEGLRIVWTEYMRYRLKMRGFDVARVEEILRHSAERYRDTVTGRLIVVGRHDQMLVMIPYEVAGDVLVPVTIHATNREQITIRLKTERLQNV